MRIHDSILLALIRVVHALIDLVSSHESHRKLPRLRLSIKHGRMSITGDTHMSFTLPDDKTATLSIQPVDAAGFPAAIDGIPVWSVSDPSVITVNVSADGLSAQLVPASPVVLGTSQVSVTVDADLGEGVTSIVGLLDVEVVAGTTVAVNISAVLN